MSTPHNAWCWRLRCNSPKGWRQHQAQQLGRLAERIDGRRVMQIEVETDPPMTRYQVASVLMQGLRCTESLLAEEVRIEGLERHMRATARDLY